MKKQILIAAVLLISSVTMAQTGKKFTLLSGKTLNDKVLTLPEAAKGKMTIIGLASSIDAQNDLQSWFEPLDDQNFFSDPDVNTFFVAATGGLSAANMKSVKDAGREAVLEEMYDLVMFYSGDKNKLNADLEVKDNKKPCIFVIDAEGKIVFHYEGKYTEKKLDEIIELVDAEVED